jgi:hypothetical protein
MPKEIGRGGQEHDICFENTILHNSDLFARQRGPQPGSREDFVIRRRSREDALYRRK